jgi:hypothetical protein
MQNGFVESFNGRLRDECLNEHLFSNLDEARQIIEEWRIDYNTNRRTRASMGSHQPSLQPAPLSSYWTTLVRTFVAYFLERDPFQQAELLDGPIRTGDFVRHTRDGESRERLREAFNTPFYPMILVTNQVMQEGLDLSQAQPWCLTVNRRGVPTPISEPSY